MKGPAVMSILLAVSLVLGSAACSNVSDEHIVTLWGQAYEAAGRMDIWDSPLVAREQLDSVCADVQGLYEGLHEREGGSAEQRLLRLAAISLQLSCENYKEDSAVVFPEFRDIRTVRDPGYERLAASWQMRTQDARFLLEDACARISSVADLLGQGAVLLC